MDAAQFVTGSGEVLIITRVLALAAWVTELTDPPTMPAASCSAGLTSPTLFAANKAPAGILDCGGCTLERGTEGGFTFLLRTAERVLVEGKEVRWLSLSQV